jgi:FkbM family methyltransferase
MVQINNWLGRWYQWFCTKTTNAATVTVGNASATFRVDTVPEYHRAANLMGERAIVADLLDHLEPDDTFWDVGANVGTYACLAADVLSDGTVIAFEPHPVNAERLEENVATNEHDNVRVERAALSATTGTASLTVDGSRPGHGRHRLSSEGTETIEVSVVRGDKYVEESPPPNVLKIDVEGNEEDILDGLSTTLAADDCRMVYVECHSEPSNTVSRIEQQLETYGFGVERIDERTTEVFVRGTKKE